MARTKFDEMMIISNLYWTNTLTWFCLWCYI